MVVSEFPPGDKVPEDGLVICAETFMTVDVAYVDVIMKTAEPTPSDT